MTDSIFSVQNDAVARLRDFGYAFNNAGELRKIDQSTGVLTDVPYQFEITDDATKNQEHYEQLAEQIPEIIYALLEHSGLRRVYIPLGETSQSASFVFSKPEHLLQSKKLLVLLHGSGFVRAGQWARRLIINNSLNHGSQLPYIERAEKLGYDILIANYNDNYRIVDGKRKPIKEVNTASNHAHYMWKNLVMGSKSKAVAIVAHSYGGAITLELLERYTKFFKENVFAVAFTDSAYGRLPNIHTDFLGKKTCNWASSNKPLDSKLSTSNDKIPCLSAGHPKHEWSSFSAIESVFRFLEENYKEHCATQQKS